MGTLNLGFPAKKKKATRALVFGGAFRAINFPLQTDIPSPCKNEDNWKIQASFVDQAQCINEPTKKEKNNLVFPTPLDSKLPSVSDYSS